MVREAGHHPLHVLVTADRVVLPLRGDQRDRVSRRGLHFQVAAMDAGTDTAVPRRPDVE